MDISIHAFRVEGDFSSIRKTIEDFIISIHAFRVEGDAILPRFVPRTSEDFNPRLPCGRRLNKIPKSLKTWRFQSTPSVWKATQCRVHSFSD